MELPTPKGGCKGNNGSETGRRKALNELGTPWCSVSANSDQIRKRPFTVHVLKSKTYLPRRPISPPQDRQHDREGGIRAPGDSLAQRKQAATPDVTLLCGAFAFLLSAGIKKQGTEAAPICSRFMVGFCLDVE